MSKKPNVLFIAYFFPPVEGGGIPGAMRILKFLRHTQTKGYVLTQKSPAFGEPDASLATELSEERIIRAGTLDPFGRLLKLQFWLKQKLRAVLKPRAKAKASETSQEAVTTSVFADEQGASQKSALGRFKDFLHNLNYFPDQASVWILPAWLAGRKVIKRAEIDVIFATGSPWSSLILGYYLSKSSGKPLIVDFRDPWINNPFHHSKGSWLDNLANKWEKKVIEHATTVSLNTEPLRDEFLARYPDIAADKFVVLPNGFDELPTDVLTMPAPSKESNALVIRHAGFLYGPRDPSALLEAIRLCNQRAESAGIESFWVFEQIGSIQLNYDVAERYHDLIVSNHFQILPQVPYAECQSLLRHADLLVNIQPATKTQIPSKIYDYLTANRPILNITPKSGALGVMIEKYGFGSCFDFTDQDALAQYLYAKLEDKSWISNEHYSNKDDFSLVNITKALDKLVHSSLRGK